MEVSDLNAESMIDILLDPRRRAKLLKAVQSENGFDLPITNRYEDVAQHCKATPDQLSQAIAALVQEDQDMEHLIEPLVYHPGTPDTVLIDLCDRNICISALGHRSGPQSLLEKLAAEHHYSEAITTLALEYYGTKDASDQAFVQFVTRYKDDAMLGWNIRNSPKLSERMRELGLSAIQQE